MSKIEVVRYSGLHRIFKPFYSGCGNVLVLHRVCDSCKSVFHKSICVSTEYLENVLEYFISEGIDIVSLDECYERITGKSKTKRFVAFTFDDGYLDNLTNALPIFEKYNVPLSLFLATGYPDRKAYLWGFLLEDVVLRNNQIEFIMDDVRMNYAAQTPDQKRDAFYKIRNYLRESPRDKLLPRLKNVFRDRYNELFELTDTLMLSWEQIIEISKHPLVTIGAHSVNHNALSNLSEEDVSKEIMGSVNTIESRTGNRVFYLAYPFGGKKEAGNREFKMAAEAGIKMAFTAQNGNIFKKDAKQMMSLPRLGINEKWSTAHLELYISGMTPFLDNFR